ncbi:hypothetical protein LZ30DRAFT_258621 [Colletotrichum cereale]|nr:hypothetical protein LZ30DRAFT_258621 [Colletotrichum cereale]
MRPAGTEKEKNKKFPANVDGLPTGIFQTFWTSCGSPRLRGRMLKINRVSRQLVLSGVRRWARAKPISTAGSASQPWMCVVFAMHDTFSQDAGGAHRLKHSKSLLGVLFYYIFDYISAKYKRGDVIQKRHDRGSLKIFRFPSQSDFAPCDLQPP